MGVMVLERGERGGGILDRLAFVSTKEQRRCLEQPDANGVIRQRGRYLRGFTADNNGRYFRGLL